MKLDQHPIPYTKIYSKWIKDLNVKPEATKFFKVNIGSKLLGLTLGNDFFFLFVDLTTKAKTIKVKNKYMELPQIKKIFTANETINKIRRQFTEFEKIFAN